VVKAEQRMKAGIKVEDDPTQIVAEGSKGEAAEKAVADAEQVKLQNL
jgi:hypothetical protein